MKFFAFLLIIVVVAVDAKIYNILRCNVQGDVIHECDGTTTPITERHERILNEYMADLAAYYRTLYGVEGLGGSRFDGRRVTKEPTYPQLCKVCDDF